MNKTRIPWADYTWNPVTGCTPVSEGCKHCYAERVALRFYKGPQTIPPSQHFKVTLHPERLDEPLLRHKPARIFVDSMSDLFHPGIPDEFIFGVWYRMALAHQHTFLVLTKRIERARPLFLKWFHSNNSVNATYAATMAGHTWPLPNVWLGVTAENQKRYDERIGLLRQTPAAKRFVSYEPALGPINLCLDSLNDLARWDSAGRELPPKKIDWVIVGGESGPGARECQEEWIDSVYEQCQAAGVPFFFKQFGNNFIPECDGTDECGPHPHCPHECIEQGHESMDGFRWETRREWPK